MPRSAPPAGKIASVADRIRAAIALSLFIASLTGFINATSTQWAISFLVATVLYLFTTVGFVFAPNDADMETDDSEESNDPDSSDS